MMSTVIRVTIETKYNANLSKNSWHGVNTKSKKKIYSNPKTQSEIDAIAWELKSQKAQLLGWDKDRKIYVDVMVYRPDMKADVQNFLNPICDGVKYGINIDDNVYAGSWDWQLVKKGEERIVIDVWQEIGND